MNIPTIPLAWFADALAAKCNFECPATQDAVDRLAAEFRNSRSHMLACLRGEDGRFTREDFTSALLSAWKPRDVLLATGRTVDEWLRILALTFSVAS